MGNLNLLKILNEKKDEEDRDIKVHPLAYKNHAFKYLYCFGLGVLAMGNMKAITETKQHFDNLLENIMLNPNYKDKIIIDINNYFDYKIDDVFEILDTKEKQYTFTADLFKLSCATLWAQEYCDKVTDIYMSVFGFSNEERRFFYDFMHAAYKYNIKLASRLYSDFEAKGYSVSYKLLKYMCGGFQLKEKYQDIILNNGMKRIIDKPTQIHGNILVCNGSSLVIEGADIKISGSVTVDGGRIRIHNSNIQVEECDNLFLLQVKNSALVSVEDSTVECNLKCAFLKQEQGYLTINNTKILHTANARSVDFSGKEFTINGSEFSDSMAGSIILTKEAAMQIDDCRFFHCEEENGGAIYADTLYDVSISNCTFRSCHSKYLGGAVYFAYKKYNQVVYASDFIKCTPADSIILNAYKEEENQFIQG